MLMLIISEIAATDPLSNVALLSLSGHSNELTYTIIAFLASTLIWVAIMALLPWWIDKKHAPKLRSYK